MKEQVEIWLFLSVQQILGHWCSQFIAKKEPSCLTLPGIWQDYYEQGFCWTSPVASLVVQMVKNLPAMQKTQVQSLGEKDPLEKESAAHSSILAWRIPWTEKPAGLPFMGSQRVRHDWATNLLSFTRCLGSECQVIYVPSCFCFCPLCHPCMSPVAMLVLNIWWLPAFANCSTPMIYFCCFPSSIFLRDLLCSMLYM